MPIADFATEEDRRYQMLGISDVSGSGPFFDAN